MRKISLLLFIALLAPFIKTHAQGFYDMSTIQKIEVNFTQSNWDYMMDTAAAGSEGYIVAQWVKINGVQFDSVGVKYKGNSSYNATQVKNPVHIELDYVNNQDYQGYTDIKLNNCFKDPTFVREVLAYSILRNYMHAPQANFAQLYINNQYIGIYSNPEAINKKFVNEHFYTNDNTLVKCNPQSVGPTSNSKSDLTYNGNDSTQYYAEYEIKSDYGWKDLVALCDTLANNSAGIENILDVDRALWMIAFDNVLVNLDSYIGGFAQNYYLYEDHNGRFNSIIWDLNESFGTFSSTGTSNLTSLTQKQQLSPTLHINDATWPLVQKLLANSQYKRMYIAHMKTILNENFSNSSYLTTAQYLQSVIDTAVQSDANKFFTYAQFQSSLNTTVNQTPAMSTLMSGRVTSLNSTTEFQQTAPSISNIQVSNTAPTLNSTVSITASITNASTAYLGLRYSIMSKFTKQQMFDDGAHGDGAAGDGVYGANIPVNSSLIHYYIYAENSNAGMFSPERAEYNYYTLNATITTVNAGEVVINELMAANTMTVQDASGKYEDWIEIYNNTPAYISMENMYLSDSYITPYKWQFPANTVIAPGSYLIVWADNDTTETGYHCNFKLGASGEQIILSYANGYVVDSTSFPAQSDDITYGRYPNATGPFGFLGATFSAVNSPLAIEETITAGTFSIYPNPSEGMVRISTANEKITSVEVFNVTGQRILNEEHASSYADIDLTSQPAGIYLVRINGSTTQRIIKN
jgi:hypothetical protein